MLGIITNHEILENMEANPQQVVLILDILNYSKIKSRYYWIIFQIFQQYPCLTHLFLMLICLRNGYDFRSFSMINCAQQVGEAEKLVRTLFMVAISRQPSVIFIDEVFLMCIDKEIVLPLLNMTRKTSQKNMFREQGIFFQLALEAMNHFRINSPGALFDNYLKF